MVSSALRKAGLLLQYGALHTPKQWLRRLVRPSINRLATEIETIGSIITHKCPDCNLLKETDH